MTAHAPEMRSKFHWQDHGTVARVDGGTVVVRSQDAELRCRRAVSCLVEPCEGDTVLVAGISTGETYVLAVLERPEGTPTTLSAPGEVTLRVPDGGLAVIARGVLSLLSSQRLTVATPSVEINARDATLSTGTATVHGAEVSVEAGRVRLLASTLESVVERVSEKVQRAFRTVAEIDHLRAGQVDYAAKHTMSLHAENAVVTAETLVKVDGEQIHMG